MKIIYKIFVIVFLLGAVNACEITDLDLQTNPNALSPDQASINDLYNNIQLTFKDVYRWSEDVPGQAARMYHAGAFTYAAFAGETAFTNLWNTAYSGLFPDIDALLVIAEEKGFDIHAGSAKIMKAYTLMALVDVLGDVPFSEMGAGTDVISPKSDPGDQVYAGAIALLDEAITQLNDTKAGAPAYDNFAGGSPEKWIKIANTLKMRAYLNTGNASSFSSIVSSGNFISDAADDFQFNFGNQRTNPNSRHPRYNNMYETDDGTYMSNYYMWMLNEEKLHQGAAKKDPRIRYYFYRKVDDAYDQDATTYSCHFTTLPSEDPGAKLSHYFAIDPNMPYCVIADGYLGRDHLNGEGIPPDGPTRTSWGLYPFGGEFDYDDFDDTRHQGTTGGLGQGIYPIMLSSFVDFMRAEAALRLGTADDARALLERGIRGSMDKVRSFESIVASTMSLELVDRLGNAITVEKAFAMTDQDVDDYVADVLSRYDAASATNKLDIVIKEFYIAAWGNGLEAYNMYRRTGLPSNMQPGLEPGGGSGADPFPVSFLYPGVHVSRNANVDQKDGMGIPVFWPMASGLY